MEIEYRAPVAADLPAVMSLMPTLYQEIGPGLPKVMAEIMGDKYYFKLMAVEKGTGATAGFMTGCCRIELDFEARVGIIEDIVVHPDRRKLGIGAAMLAEFEKWAVVRGAEGILVPCGREGFYEKMGFTMYPVKRFWKELKRE